MKISASKGRFSANSPHPIKGKRDVFPHILKKAARGQLDTPREWILQRSRNLDWAFQQTPKTFWEKVESLRKIDRKIIAQKRINLGANILSEVQHTSEFPARLKGAFITAFVDAVRDPKFPSKRKTQCKFLGRSLAAWGEVTARRSRDIYFEENARDKRASSKPVAELYIKCCGKARWTENQICPECKQDPLFRLSPSHSIRDGTSVGLTSPARKA